MRGVEDLGQCDQIWQFIEILGKFLKPLATINLPKSPTFLGNFCKGVKTFNFSHEIILGIFIDIWRFFLVTLILANFLTGRFKKFGHSRQLSFLSFHLVNTVDS